MTPDRPGRTVPGIHHVTAIAGAPQENVDFYTKVMGQRFVKKTVNFGDPSTYHLYYGDAEGRPGTILTFFAWPGAGRGREGAGVPIATAYSVPEDSLGSWKAALLEEGVEEQKFFERFGRPGLALRDPHGLRLELVGESTADSDPDWAAGPVPPFRATRGFHGMSLSVDAPEETGRLLMEVLGYEAAGEEEGAEGRRYRFRVPGDAKGRVLDLVRQHDRPPSGMGVGVVHHIAFRARDDDEQAAWSEELKTRGFDVTSVRDRRYFRSIYFREPSGVLFEIATDLPGFTRDETLEGLGTEFRLPPWLESDRKRIVDGLPEIEL